MSINDFIYPNFKRSIVNIAATLAEFLGQKPRHATLPELAEKLKPTYKNVVYLVFDGMGSRILAKNLPADSYLRTHQIAELTSVFPSTTAAATTSLLSGLTPAEHGWFAWSVDFDGQVIELFPNRNFYTRELTADRDFAHHHLPYQSFFANAPVKREIYTCYPDDISSVIRSPHEIEFHTLGQMCRKLHKICHQPNQKFIYGYYTNVDTTMHHFGTTARQTKRLLTKIDRKIAKLAQRHPDTLFVITADHGQTDIRGFTAIRDDAAIQKCLAHPLSMDPRGTCFKIKPGMHEQFLRAFQKYTQDYTLFPSADLVNRGVFGEFNLHPDYQQRLGDYIAVGTQAGKMMLFKPGKEFYDKKQKHVVRGCHTGMTPDEMYVPLIVVGANPPTGR